MSITFRLFARIWFLLNKYAAPLCVCSEDIVYLKWGWVRKRHIL